MLVLDREAAVDQWRRAEARIYPSVMVNAELYQQYIGVVRAVAEELRDVRTEDDLVAAWHERGDVVREVVSRSAPPMLAIMDLGAVRDAAFCHRHRELTREQGKALAAERLLRAKRQEPSGSSCSRTSRRSAPTGWRCTSPPGARCTRRPSCRSTPSRPKFTLAVVHLDPADGAWQLDKAPAMPEQTFDTREEWEARIEQARVLFGRR